MSDPQEASSRSMRDSIDGSIKIRMLVLLGLLVFKLVAMVRLISAHDANPAWLLVGIAGGLVIGLIATRMHITSWDKSAKTVVSQMDSVGIFVLITYILYAIFSDELVEMGIKNAAAAGLVVTSMAVTVTLIRLRDTYHDVAAVLREAGLLPAKS